MLSCGNLCGADNEAQSPELCVMEAVGGIQTRWCPITEISTVHGGGSTWEVVS